MLSTERLDTPVSVSILDRMTGRMSRKLIAALFAVWSLAAALCGESVERAPFRGVTHIARTETAPRETSIHVVKIDLTAPGIRIKVTGPGGTRETVRQRTREFLEQEHAQVAINGHFFLPFPSEESESWVIGLAASEGSVYSGFEKPAQSYALVSYAPALNIDPDNQASIVHYDEEAGDPVRVKERVTLWNAVSGSAQIVTNGAVTIPKYVDEENPDGELTPGGPGSYTNANSWYAIPNARTVIGLSEDRQTLVLFTVDRAYGSRGMTLAEAAEMLIRDYGVVDALNLDGGGSTTLAMQNPDTGVGEVINTPSESRSGRPVASNITIFAHTIPDKD
jgi:hypothetical protein